MEIENEIVEYVKKEPTVIGALIFGSYARNPEGKHNDIDVLVATNANWKKRESITIQELHVEVFYNNINEIKKELNHPFELDRNSWFEYTKILFDTNNKIQELINYAQNTTKQKLANFNKNWWQYKIGDTLQDLQNETNPNQKAFLSQCLFRDIITTFFLSKHTLPPKDNYCIKKIELIDKKFSNIANKFTQTANLDEQEQLICKMLNYLEKDLGKPTTRLTTTKTSINISNQSKPPKMRFK